MDKGKVLLAMSGGTDSSVCAMMLLEQGYEVEGVTFRMFDTDDDEPSFIADARALADKLGFPHHTMDIRNAFQEWVINYFRDEFVEGRTPHPCVQCNNHIKWPYLIDKANELGIFYVATGHYADVEQYDGLHYIVAGKDPEKEQSLFLWGLPEETTSRIVFPLGSLHKTEVRAYAAEKGFAKVSTRKDSMGVCFSGPDYRPLLGELLAAQGISIGEGTFVDKEGNVLGKHPGYINFTIGQRRGLGIHLNRALYVVGIVPEKNQIVLGDRNDLLTDEIILNQIHLPNADEVLGKRVEVRIRYRKQSVMGTVERIGNTKLRVLLEEPEIREANGQTATFYIGNRVVGGGWIIQSNQNNL